MLDPEGNSICITALQCRVMRKKMNHEFLTRKSPFQPEASSDNLACANVYIYTNMQS